ncbi:MAG: C4-dicarboxylate ABC transporter substrate-binding protein, partial [Burkholderiaceae bacterium]
LASLVARIAIVLLPLLIVVVPATLMVAPLYQWRMRSRIYRWYGALMTLERALLTSPDQAERNELMKQLEDIENSVNGLHLPLAFADQQYVLREHIAMVRARINAQLDAFAAPPATAA